MAVAQSLAMRRPAKRESIDDMPDSGVGLRVERRFAVADAALHVRIAALPLLLAEGDRRGLAAEVRVITADLRAQLARDAGENGLYEMILGLAPRLAPRVRALRAQHEWLCFDLAALERYGHAQAPMLLSRHYLTCLREGYDEHRALEENLLQDALMTDLGDAD